MRRHASPRTKPSRPPGALVDRPSDTQSSDADGRKLDLDPERGKLHSAPLAPRVVATVHPSSILRAPDEREREMAAFVKDLRAVKKLMG